MTSITHELRVLGWRRTVAYTAWALIFTGLCWAGVLIAWAATLPLPQ